MDSTSISINTPMHPFWETLFSLPPWMSFGFAIIISSIAVFLQQEVLLTENLYFNTFGEQMAYERIKDMIEQQRKYKWVAYSITPIVLLLQVLLITICLNIGTILYEYKLSFRKLFGMVTRAMVWIALIGSLQMLPLLLTDIETIDQLIGIDWFSVAALLGEVDLPIWVVVPLKMLNLILLLSFLVLAGGMYWLTRRPYHKMLSFVLGTYGTGMLLLVLVL
ncbi:MAG: hypothetical protein AAF242_11270, partial [Bacteroidota bacterium]